MSGIAVDMAYEIVDMNEELIMLREEVRCLEDYKKKYTQLLDSSISHNNVMVGNVLTALLDKREKYHNE